MSLVSVHLTSRPCCPYRNARAVGLPTSEGGDGEDQNGRQLSLLAPGWAHHVTELTPVG